MIGGRKPKEDVKERDFKARDPAALRINEELTRLKARFESEGVGEDEKLERLIAHAEEMLRADPPLAKNHRFSWVSGMIEERQLPRE
jgi:hypothetical protein